ncbi:MAG TPA: SGNH/GDSL hydrolase family protein [Planctomycetota bacterium]
MRPGSTKVLLALGAAAAAGLVFALFLRVQPPAGDELTLVPIQRDLGGVPALPGTRAGIDPLDAELTSRFPPSTFLRRPLSPEEVELLFALGQREFDVYDPHCYFVKRAGLEGRRDWPEHPEGHYAWRTNSLGLRGSAEPAPTSPDLRVLVVGDSHTEGVCLDAETFPARLEQGLRQAHPDRTIEVLNAARGGYSFFQYLGALERALELEPDVLVVGIYGGNDFEEVLTPHHYFQGTLRPPADKFRELRARALKGHVASIGQALNSVKYFATWPDQVDVALQAIRDCCTEIQALCLRRSIHPVFVFIPSAAEIEPDGHPKLREALAMLEVSPEDLRTSERMADSLLAFLRQRGLDVLDMRPVFRSTDVLLYWKADLHSNLEALRLIAAELLALFERRGLVLGQRVRAAPGRPR